MTDSTISQLDRYDSFEMDGEEVVIYDIENESAWIQSETSFVRGDVA